MFEVILGTVSFLFVPPPMMKWAGGHLFFRRKLGGSSLGNVITITCHSVFRIPLNDVQKVLLSLNASKKCAPQCN